MQWTVQVIVAFFNIAWILFFLHPDPLSLSIQRRSSDSSDEEVTFGEFCIQPHFEMNWTSTLQNSTTDETSNNTRAKSNRKSKPTPDETNLLNKTKTQLKDVHTSHSSEIDCRFPASGCKPQTINLDETPATPPSPPSVQRQTPSEVPAASQLVSTSSSETARVKVTRQSEPTVRKTDSQDPQLPRSGMAPINVCCLNFISKRIPLGRIKGYTIQSRPGCPVDAVILITVKGKRICVNPHDEWIRPIIRP